MIFKVTKQEQARINEIVDEEARHEVFIYDEICKGIKDKEEYKYIIDTYAKEREAREKEITYLIEQSEKQRLKDYTEEEIINDAEEKTKGIIPYLCQRIYETLPKEDRLNKNLVFNLNNAFFRITIDYFIQEDMKDILIKRDYKILFKFDAKGLKKYLNENTLKEHRQLLNIYYIKELERRIDSIIDASPYVIYNNKEFEKEKEVSLLDKDNILIYHGKATDLVLNPKNITDLGWKTKDGLFECVTNDIVGFRKGNIKTHQLLMVAIGYFTKNNTHRIAKNLTVQIPLDDFINCFGYESNHSNNSMDDLRKENERIRKYKKRTENEILDSIKILCSHSLTFSEKIKGKAEKYAQVNYFDSAGYIRDGYIVLNFGYTIASILAELPQTSYPLKLLTLGERDSNAYRVGFKISLIANNSNNRKRGNADRITVKKLLEVTDLITIEELTQEGKGRQWKQRIKKYLENALDKNKDITIASWHYERHKKEIGREAACNNGYTDFSDTLIVFKYLY